MVLKGEIAVKRLFDEKKLNEIIKYSKTLGIELERKGLIIKESPEFMELIIIPKEFWISIGFLGITFTQWLAGKFFDLLLEKVKKLLMFSKKKDTQLLLDLKTKDRNLLINFDLGLEKDTNFAFNKLKEYLTNNKEVNGWIWYNDKLREWGDINKVEEWKKDGSNKTI